jgi:methionine aminotransferase
MRITLDSKLPHVGTTIFTVMSKLAADCGAINLSQGFPSFQPPQELLERICAQYRHGDNQYAPMPGVPALCEVLAEKTERIHGRIVDPAAEITVSSGATEALFSTIQAVVRPGDEVIVFDPAYDAYEPAIILAGGRARHVPLASASEGHGFELDWQRFEDALGTRTRLVICNFPHNPTGTLFASADLDRIAALLRGTKVLLLSDEVYEHIVLDGATHTSLLGHDELWERSFVVSSFGKTLHATGWKIGYCIAPRALSAEFRRVHQFTVFTVNTPVQHALAEFLRAEPDFHQRLPGFYQARRDRFLTGLSGSRFRWTPAPSTFFQVLDYSDISDEPDSDLALRWTREIGVASIPLSVFCEQPFTGRRLRFCFAKDDATLDLATERLRSL